MRFLIESTQISSSFLDCTFVFVTYLQRQASARRCGEERCEGKEKNEKDRILARDFVHEQNRTEQNRRFFVLIFLPPRDGVFLITFIIKRTSFPGAEKCAEKCANFLTELCRASKLLRSQER